LSRGRLASWLASATLRGRIEAVLNAARALGHIDDDKANPARWKGHLDQLLPNPKKVGERGNYAAMPYADLPAFMAKLKDADGTAALALTFAIVTAARSGEVMGARWDEIDLKAGVWTVPKDRMKAKREHRVPFNAPHSLFSASSSQRGARTTPTFSPARCRAVP
jgi:integrase